MTGLVMLPSLEFFSECYFRQVKQLSQKVWAGRRPLRLNQAEAVVGERRYLTQKQSTSQMFLPKLTNQNENSIELKTWDCVGCA